MAAALLASSHKYVSFHMQRSLLTQIGFFPQMKVTFHVISVPFYIQYVGLFPHTVCESLPTYTMWVSSHIQYVGLFPHTVCGSLSTYSMWVSFHIQYVGLFPHTVCESLSTYIGAETLTYVGLFSHKKVSFRK